jgi:DNA helicase-2/ATP-dependent DNA helicase PcrA
VLGGTIHSVAHRFVRGHAATLGLGSDFAVLDAGDAADLLDLVRQEQGHGETGRRFPRKHTLADIYSRTVNAQRPVREVVAESFPWCEEHLDVLGPLFRALTARKRALGAVDLDDLLVMWRALMVDEQAGAHIASSFDHVLVDEYQDVNGRQVAIVEGFARRGCHITAVGDDFQAIYAFRSASARHILEFPGRFAAATRVTLERNYRATQPLLDVANNVALQDAEGLACRPTSLVRAGMPDGPQSVGQATRRSLAGGTKTIRAAGSSLGVVISTIAWSRSRSSSTPPRAPAGASSIGSSSPTRSKAVISRTTATGSC